MSIQRNSLKAFFQRYRARAGARYLLETIAVLLAFVCLLLTSLYFFESAWFVTESEKVALFGLAVLIPLIICVIQIDRFRRGTDPLFVSVYVEQASGVDFNNELVTAVEYQAKPEMPENYGYSKDLLFACVSSAEQKLPRISLSNIIPFKRAGKLLIVAFIALLPLGGIIHYNPWEFGQFFHSWISLPAGYENPGSALPVSPGTITVPSGSTVELAVCCPPSINTRPVLERWTDTDIIHRLDTEQKGAPVPDGQRIYSVKLTDVTTDFSYRFAVGPVRTNLNVITVVAPPVLTEGTITYTYPPYTRLEPEVQKADSLDVRAPEGTAIVWELTYSKDLASAQLKTDTTAVTGTVDGSTVRFSLTPFVSEKYVITAIDENGFSDPSLEKSNIQVFEDELPKTFVLAPAENLSVEASDVMTVFNIEVFGEDDYGITAAELVYTLRQRYEYTFSEFEQTVPVLFAEPLSRFTTTVSMDLTQSILQPGDSVSYYFRAFDSGDKDRFGKTRSWKITIPYETDDFEELLEEHQEGIVSVDSVLEKQKELDSRLDDVVKRAAEKKALKWRDRQELKKIMDSQKKLQKDAAEITAKLEKTIQKADNRNYLDESTLKKLQEVHELMAEVTSSRMKNLMQKMQDLMANTDFSQKKMNSMMKDFDKDKYAKELEKVLNNLKKIKAQQELNRAIMETQKLVEDQEELLQKTMEKMSDGKELSSLEKPQAELADTAKDVQNRLSKLAKDMESQFPESASQVQKEAERKNGEKAASDMKAAAEGLKNNDGRKALDNQRKALNKMRSSLEELNQIKGKMKKKQASVNIEAVRQLLYKAVELAPVCADIAPEPSPLDVLSEMPATRALRRQACREMALKVNRVWQRFVSFESDFNTLFADELMFKTSYLTAISELIETSRKARHDFEQVAYFSGIQLARQASANFNDIILQLLLLAENMKNQQSQSSQDDFMEQMEEMIRRQEELNKMCNQQGQRPKSDPMMEQIFNQMASEQEMIRRSMEELAKRYEEGMKLDEKLQKVSEEMKEVEKRLRDLDGSEKTQQAQKKIVTRMLDYTRSMHNQDYSKKRKSKEGVFDGISTGADLSTELTETKKELFKNLTGDAYPPEYRKQVESYLKSIFDADSGKDGVN